MEKLFKVPLIFLFVASCMGLFLRYQLIAPVGGVVYSYVLHAHSHVMFLGWVFNVLVLAFTREFAVTRGFKTMFWFLQICVVGMLVSFPLQGYGLYSITFSTLHTLAAIVFIIQFIRETRGKSTIAYTLSKAALLFFAVSSIGPFVLGYLKANGLDHLDIYRNSIYFYLHFQYNGFFFFGVLSLLLKLAEPQLSATQTRNAQIGSYLLIGCCVPAYALSTLWGDPGMIFNSIGFVSATGQLIGLGFFIKPLSHFLKNERLNRQEKLLFTLSFSAIALKSVLQVLSAHPSIATFANEFRSIVIAYLHLVLLGGISLFLIAWLSRRGIIQLHNSWAIGLILVGFVTSELILISFPWITSFFPVPARIPSLSLFFLSGVMVLGVGGITRAAFAQKA